MATYVCSDIHGMYDKFLEMIKKIDFKKEDKLYVIGDSIDRSLDSIKTITHIMNTSNMFLILGNHELSMLDYYRGKWAHESWADHEWFTIGGELTRKKFIQLDKECKKEILDYIESLPSYLIINNFVLVHGGFYCEKDEVTLEEALYHSNKDELAWNREFFEDDKRLTGYTVIMGHTPVAYFGEDTIIHKNGKILIDCGCVFGGKLACLRLDDMKEFYI